jgi:hypothetical protein
VIRDRRIADDQDYAAIQSQTDELAPVGARTVRQASFAAGQAGSITGWLVIILIVLLGPVAALWQLF